MSLIKDDEFVVIHLDENSEVNDSVETLPTEYIEMKTFTQEEQELLNTPQEELVNRILDEIIQDVVEKFRKNESAVITEQPRLKVKCKSQTDETYNSSVKRDGNIKLSINEEQDFQAQEEYEAIIREEEEPCLHHYKSKKRNHRKRKKMPSNKNDCLSGLKRFLKYVFNS